MEYPVHPLSEIFPLMTEHEYEALKSDIDKNGLQCPIMLYEDKILDGRNRYNACLDTGTEPEFVQYKGKNPEAFVVSLNLHRRQLTKAQLGLVGARIANAKAGNPFNTPSRQTIYTNKQAAELVGVHEDTIDTAKYFLKKADPTLVKLVEEPGSKLSLKAAIRVADLPIEDQQELTKQGVKAVKEKAAELRRPPPPPQDQRLLVSGPTSIGQLKTLAIGTIQQMRQSAFVDSASTAALDAVIAECEKLKREILEMGDKK